MTQFMNPHRGPQSCSHAGQGQGQRHAMPIKGQAALRHLREGGEAVDNGLSPSSRGSGGSQHARA